ncbi:DUF2243 domain-containing protein [Halopseudomonas sp.]|uniref:DUF2243 domain-containing protein n=1 Tax=Halopseudomonas sp. TaxID=2901191 RepID=UPI00300115A4
MASPDHIHSGFNRSVLATLLIGVGVMAAVDEIVFHQLLAWHHFFDRSTLAIGLLSDGLLHSAELLMLVAGFFMLARLRGDGLFDRAAGWAGFFIGAGAFQLFDGIVNHKVLRLHQVRYVENLLLYDVFWNLAGLVLTGIGLWLLRRARRRPAV